MALELREHLFRTMSFSRETRRMTDGSMIIKPAPRLARHRSRAGQPNIAETTL
jgi:hypothetical protein